uniref:Uncharacterized protein n=1 Tax=Lepeophtheirus salmonis TaxID=72036 RepID=A0A0K2TZY6_LEPSM
MFLILLIAEQNPKEKEKKRKRKFVKLQVLENENVKKNERLISGRSSHQFVPPVTTIEEFYYCYFQYHLLHFLTERTLFLSFFLF